MSKTKEPPASTLDELKRHLEQLKLRAMLAALDTALAEAATLNQGYVTFLANLVAREALTRTDAAGQRRIAAADFPALKTFDGFNWSFQPHLNVPLVKDLMNLQFVRQGRPLLILGKPGTGKTHLSIAYGVLAALAGLHVRFYSAAKLLAELYASLADRTLDALVARLARADLLICDDLRNVAPPREEYASLLFEIVDARYRAHRAMIMSSNLGVRAWSKVLGDAALTTAILDRLMEGAHVLNIKPGISYRTHGPDAPPEATHLPDLTGEDEE
jgi:DNA replication protein DnaC